MIVLKLLIIAATWGSLFFIFFDYHNKSNIRKSITFIVLVLGGTSLTAFLVQALRFNILYLLPIYAFLPFAVALRKKKKGNSEEDPFL